jgi:hypothetical protein
VGSAGRQEKTADSVCVWLSGLCNPVRPLIFPLKEFVDVLSRTLVSLLTAAALGGTLLAAPAQAAPTGSSLVDRAQKEEVSGLFTQRDYHIFPKVPETIAPLKPTLPAGTTLTLDEGAELDRIRGYGWSIAVSDNIMTVTAPGRAEGYCAVPVIVTHPDGSDEATDVIMYVDYMIDTGFLGSVLRTLTSSSPRPSGGDC